MNSILNLHELSDSLSSAGQPTREQFAEIASAGFEVVINLALSTSDNAIPDETELVNSLGMSHIHIPVVWDSPQPEDLERFMDEMEKNQAKKIFIHCAMNYRASAFIALWRTLRQGCEKEKAFALQSSLWNLDDYPVWKNFIETALSGNY